MLGAGRGTLSWGFSGEEFLNCSLVAFGSRKRFLTFGLQHPDVALKYAQRYSIDGIL